jgi:ketosteroid isomerase-like protein
VDFRPLIEAYYDACNNGDADALAAMFSEDVVHYFLEPNLAPAPVRGRNHLANYWRKVQRSIDGHWVVDHCLSGETEAVIEWTLFWTPPETGERVATRGAEWYVFDRGLIAEVRAYYRQEAATSELAGFPYRDRGYSLL